MRKTLATALLVLALSNPAFAGIIQNPVATQPPPPPPQASEEQSANGDMHFPIADTTLSLLGNLLALF